MPGAWIRHSTFGVVPYSCAGHRVPWICCSREKNISRYVFLLYAHSICECRSRGAIRCPVWNTSHTADFMIHVRGDVTLTIGPYGSAGTCIINYAPPQINVVDIRHCVIVSSQFQAYVKISAVAPCGLWMAFSWRGCSLETIPPVGRRSPLLRTRGYVILWGNRGGSVGSQRCHSCLETK